MTVKKSVSRPTRQDRASKAALDKKFPSTKGVAERQSAASTKASKAAMDARYGTKKPAAKKK